MADPREVALPVGSNLRPPTPCHKAPGSPRSHGLASSPPAVTYGGSPDAVHRSGEDGAGTRRIAVTVLSRRRLGPAVREPTARCAEVRDALLNEFPFLREGALPGSTWFGPPPEDPDLFPDDRQDRGFLVALPPPKGLKVDDRRLPRLVGVHRGRPVRVDLFFGDPVRNPELAPCLWVRAAVRLHRPGSSPVPEVPWFTALPPDVGIESGFTRLGTSNMVGLLGARALRSLIRRSGPRAGSARPPWVPGPLILESSDPSVREWLEGGAFLEPYHRWEELTGPPLGRSGPVRPVIHSEADRFSAVGGLGPRASPGSAGGILRDCLRILEQVEEVALGPEVVAEPWSTVTFEGPSGSLPDVRHGLPCPQCGQLELVRHRFDPAARTHRWRSHRCDVDLFRSETDPPRPR